MSRKQLYKVTKYLSAEENENITDDFQGNDDETSKPNFYKV